MAAGTKPRSPHVQSMLDLQRTAGNAALVADLHGAQALGVQRQSAPAVEQRYRLTIRGQLYPALESTEALARLGRHRQYLAAMVDNGVDNHQFLKSNREEHSVVGWIADAIGGVELPPLSIWDVPRRTLAAAQAALDAGQVAEASRLLDQADAETRACDRRVTNYREGSISGAEVGEGIAIGVAVTCAVVFVAAGGAAIAGAGAASGGAGAGVAGTAGAAGAAGETAAGVATATAAGETAAGVGTATATAAGETAAGVGTATATAAGETAAGVGTAAATGETAAGVGTAVASGETAAGVGTATAAGETAAGATVAGEVAAGLAPEAVAAAEGAAVGAETTAASGAVNTAGKLMQVLRAIESSWAGAGPKTAWDSLSVIQTAVRSVGLEPGVLSYLPGGAMLLKNFGGITTYLLVNGQILVMRGTQVLLNLKP